MPTRLEHLVGESLQQYVKTGKVEFFTAKFHHPSSVASIIATLMVVIWVIVFIAIFVTITDSEYIPDEIRQYLPYFILFLLFVVIILLLFVFSKKEIGSITLLNGIVSIQLLSTHKTSPTIWSYPLSEITLKCRVNRNSDMIRSYFILRIVHNGKTATFFVDATNQYFEYRAFMKVLQQLQADQQ